MPAPAPLDSCLRRNDALGAGAHDAVRVRVTAGRILRVGGGPFDRLRANGVASWCCGALGWPACRGSCLRRNDGLGAGAHGGGRVRVTSVGFPLSRDGRFANRPYGGLGELGMRRGFGVGVPCPAPLWIPAFAGKTMGVCGKDEGRKWPAPRRCPGFPLSRERRWGCVGRQVLVVAEG